MTLLERHPKFAKALKTELDQRPGWNVKMTGAQDDYPCDVSEAGCWYSLGFLGERVVIYKVPKTVFDPVDPAAVSKMADYLEKWSHGPNKPLRVYWS